MRLIGIIVLFLPMAGAFAQAPGSSLSLTTTDAWAIPAEHVEYPKPRTGMYFLGVGVTVSSNAALDHPAVNGSARNFRFVTPESAYPAIGDGADRLVRNVCDFVLRPRSTVKCNLAFELPFNTRAGELEFADAALGSARAVTKLGRPTVLPCRAGRLIYFAYFVVGVAVYSFARRLWFRESPTWRGLIAGRLGTIALILAGLGLVGVLFVRCP